MNFPSSLSESAFLDSILPTVSKLEDAKEFDNALGVLVAALAVYTGPVETRRMGLAALAGIKLKQAQELMAQFQKAGDELQEFLQVTEEEKQAVKEIMEVALKLEADGLQQLTYIGT